MSWLMAAIGAPIGGTIAAAAAGAPASPPGASRVEARSADLLAVGLIQGGRMTIHISRLIDNAPVRDVAVKVLLRGAARPATAETDGSFSLQSADLALPGSAAVDFLVTQAGGADETLKGTLVIADGSGRTENKNTSRQLWWWVLNFGVCIGFLYLISRRRKSAQNGGPKD
jgi:hypothetical protein